MDKISKKDIIDAIKEIEDNADLRKGRTSTTYDLIYNNIAYPPKLVISIANKFATGQELRPNDFPGGMDTPAFNLLESFGFEIHKKKDPVKFLIENYKKHIKITELKDEIYKWKLINEFKGRPNTDAEDFHLEIKSINFENLVYAMAKGVLNHIAKEKPEELRLIFKNLYDENKGLAERILSFNEDSLKIYRTMGETMPHHQDERSIATYLTFHNPDKYTLYKSTVYKRYCQLIGIKESKKNEKYLHYLELINDLIENYIKVDSELISQVKKMIPEYYDGKNHNLLVQDILYQMLDKENEINYWIFQGNPKIYNMQEALMTNSIKTWTVSSHKDKIKIGDKFILWQTGSDSGCYALGEVTSEVKMMKEEDEEMDHYITPTAKIENNRVEIKIIKNLANKPILWQSIKDEEVFTNFKGGNQGTNFSSTIDEYKGMVKLIESQSNRKYWLYAPGLNASMWDEFYDKGIMGLGWDEIGDLNLLGDKRDITQTIQNILKTESKSFNSALANIEFRDSISIGDIIIAKKGRQDYLGYGIVTSDYFYDELRESFKKCRKVEWVKKGIWSEPEADIVLKTLTDITKYPTYVERLKKLIGIEMDEQTTKSLKRDLELNQILYGPPGTGKTYRLQKDYFKRFTINESTLTKEQFLENLVQDLTWWQVISIAVYDLNSAKVNDIHEHELIRAKEKNSNTKSIRPTIWGQLQAHTVLDCQYVNVVARNEPLFFNKDQESRWSIDKVLLEQFYPEAFEILVKSKNFLADTNKSIKNYEFITFHQSFSYEDFIEGIKPKLDDNENDVSYEIRDGVFKKLCLKAEADPANDYAIFIDEINRGNVSAIFGELITLVENDKRIGCVNEIKVRLPYSKTEFGVPSNLHIIGTMNTADRSVEALDTALRRRFSFLEIMPDSTLLAKVAFKGFNLATVLDTINQRIEVLLDRDHTIGHSYFLKLESGDTNGLKSVFINNIIPLLQEYFYHDYEKIALILGEGFVKIKENKKVSFANFKNIDSPEIATQFELINSIDDIEKAVSLLLNN